MSFPRWLRAVSEEQLLIAAQRQIASRYGVPAPPPSRGINVFWQRVYAPLFYKLPYRLRARVADLMPGSHRRTWHRPRQVQGPAV
jgi:hypothetical protein